MLCDLCEMYSHTHQSSTVLHGVCTGSQRNDREPQEASNPTTQQVPQSTSAQHSQTSSSSSDGTQLRSRLRTTAASTGDSGSSRDDSGQTGYAGHTTSRTAESEQPSQQQEEGGDNSLITVRLIMYGSTTKPVRVSPTATLADMRRYDVVYIQGITLHSYWYTVCIFGCSFGGGGGRGLTCTCNCVPDLASSPGPSQLFSLAGKKRERAWYLKSRNKHWQNGVALASPQSVNFKPVWHLWSTKRSSARPLRIVLRSLIVSVAFFSPVLNQSARKSRLQMRNFHNPPPFLP